MTKVDSPTPKTESWPTWPGSNEKRFIFSSSFRTTRNDFILGVSSITPITVARSGKIGVLYGCC